MFTVRNVGGEAVVVHTPKQPGLFVRVEPGKEISGKQVEIPGDVMIVRREGSVIEVRKR